VSFCRKAFAEAAVRGMIKINAIITIYFYELYGCSPELKVMFRRFCTVSAELWLLLPQEFNFMELFISRHNELLLPPFF
jgi:hypothetical protein